jgi:anti-anti-sigma factor
MTVRSPVPPPGVIVLRLPSEVDLAVAQKIRDDLTGSLSAEGAHLVVDAADVTFMDSSGVNALVQAYEKAAGLGGSLHVVSTASAVRRVLEVTGLAGRLGLVASVDDAFGCLSNPETIHTCETGDLI